MLNRELVFAERAHRGGVAPATFEDESRYGIPPIGVAAPTWTKQGSGLWLRTYNGATQYHYATNANTKHLEFTTGSYSITFWINLIDTGQSEILIARYELDVGGWEIYWTFTGGVYSITQRHSHAGKATDRTASNSEGWNEGIPMMAALVYTGDATDALHYRNAVPLAVDTTPGGLLDPLVTTQDLVTLRYTKDANWIEGQTGLLKIWNYALSAAEIYKIFTAERSLFGV